MLIIERNIKIDLNYPGYIILTCKHVQVKIDMYCDLIKLYHVENLFKHIVINLLKKVTIS